MSVPAVVVEPSVTFTIITNHQDLPFTRFQHAFGLCPLLASAFVCVVQGVLGRTASIHDPDALDVTLASGEVGEPHGGAVTLDPAQRLLHRHRGKRRVLDCGPRSHPSPCTQRSPGSSCGLVGRIHHDAEILWASSNSRHVHARSTPIDYPVVAGAIHASECQGLHRIAAFGLAICYFIGLRRSRCLHAGTPWSRRRNRP